MSGATRDPASRPGEYEFEAQHGLPEALPEGEEILWQGTPRWQALARRVFFVRWVAVYFGLVLAWRLTSGLLANATAIELGVSVLWVLGPALASIGLLSLLAWLNAQVTVYTITNRRVVIRLGVAFQLTLNLPFAKVQSADFDAHPDGTGEIALKMSDTEDLGYVMLWPHVRPWRLGGDLQPALRSVPDARRVAEILGKALAASASPYAVHVDPTRTQGRSRSSDASPRIRPEAFEPEAAMAR